LTAAGEGVEVVSVTNPIGFIQILPQNPESFELEPPPAGSCSL
jgi:hypothetical protein